MLEPLNKEMAAMLEPRPNHSGYYAKNMAVDHVSENQQ